MRGTIANGSVETSVARDSADDDELPF